MFSERSGILARRSPAGAQTMQGKYHGREEQEKEQEQDQQSQKIVVTATTTAAAKTKKNYLVDKQKERTTSDILIFPQSTPECYPLVDSPRRRNKNSVKLGPLYRLNQFINDEIPASEVLYLESEQGKAYSRLFLQLKEQQQQQQQQRYEAKSSIVSSSTDRHQNIGYSRHRETSDVSALKQKPSKHLLALSVLDVPIISKKFACQTLANVFQMLLEEQRREITKQTLLPLFKEVVYTYCKDRPNSHDSSSSSSAKTDRRSPGKWTFNSRLLSNSPQHRIEKVFTTPSGLEGDSSSSSSSSPPSSSEQHIFMRNTEASIFSMLNGDEYIMHKAVCVSVGRDKDGKLTTASSTTNITSLHAANLNIQLKLASKAAKHLASPQDAPRGLLWCCGSPAPQLEYATVRMTEFFGDVSAKQHLFPSEMLQEFFRISPLEKKKQQRIDFQVALTRVQSNLCLPSNDELITSFGECDAMFFMLQQFARTYLVTPVKKNISFPLFRRFRSRRMLAALDNFAALQISSMCSNWINDMDGHRKTLIHRMQEDGMAFIDEIKPIASNIVDEIKSVFVVEEKPSKQSGSGSGSGSKGDEKLDALLDATVERVMNQIQQHPAVSRIGSATTTTAKTSTGTVREGQSLGVTCEYVGHLLENTVIPELVCRIHSSSLVSDQQTLKLCADLFNFSFVAGMLVEDARVEMISTFRLYFGILLPSIAKALISLARVVDSCRGNEGGAVCRGFGGKGTPERLSRLMKEANIESIFLMHQKLESNLLELKKKLSRSCLHNQESVFLFAKLNQSLLDVFAVALEAIRSRLHERIEFIGTESIPEQQRAILTEFWSSTLLAFQMVTRDATILLYSTLGSLSELMFSIGVNTELEERESFVSHKDSAPLSPPSPPPPPHLASVNLTISDIRQNVVRVTVPLYSRTVIARLLSSLVGAFCQPRDAR